MPWKMVTRCGANMTLKKAVEEVKVCEENRKLDSKFEAKHRDEIDETLGLIDCIDKGYVEGRFPEIYKFGPERLGIHLKDKLVLEDYSSGCPIDRSYNQLDYFKRPLKRIRVEILMRLNMLIKKVKSFIDKLLDELELEDVRAIRQKVKYPRKLDISVFYQLTGRLPHKGIKSKEEGFIIHFYHTFVAASIKLLTPLCNSPHGVVFTVEDFSIKSKIPWRSRKISWRTNCKNRGGVTFPRFENSQNQSRSVLI